MTRSHSSPNRPISSPHCNFSPSWLKTPRARGCETNTSSVNLVPAEWSGARCKRYSSPIRLRHLKKTSTRRIRPRRGQAITESQVTWEREGLDWLRDQPPDAAPRRVQSSFDLIDDEGKVNEVSALRA